MSCEKLVRRTAAGCLALTAGALSLSCGKKGPPLPPLPGSVPRVSDMALRQEGREVHATFELPRRPGETELDYAILGMELWRRPAEVGTSSAEEEEIGLRDFTDDALEVADVTGDDLFEVMRTRPELVDVVPPALDFTELEYAVVLRTSVRKRGTLSNVARFIPRPPPSPPADLWLEPTEDSIVLAWSVPEPPPPLPEQLAGEPEDVDLAAPGPADPAAVGAVSDSPEAESEVDAAAPGAEGPPPPKQRFNVYRATGSGPWGIAPLNGEPLRGEQHVDRDIRPGTVYRYRVRTAVGEPPTLVLSEPSAVAELEYLDVFAPMPPTGLRTIVEGSRAVGLVWNPGTAPDLGGYGVYRRLLGVTDWDRLDRGEVRTATYSDSTVEPGLTFEYAVTAYDRTDPPNESEKSSVQRADVPAPLPR